MTIDVALAAAVALLAVLVAALLRAVAELRTRVEVLERTLARGKKRSNKREHTLATATAPESESIMTVETSAVSAGGDADGDAIDVTGVTPHGTTVTIALERPAQPTLLAFLSTSCGICTTLWGRLGQEGLQQVRPVVITKDADKEDMEQVRALSQGDLAVVLSGEAWDDYEVPGSPYFLLIGGDTGSVLAEGTASRWEDVVALAAKA